METRTAVLRPDVHSKETLEFENQLRAKIVGQDAGIAALVELYQIFCANLNAPNRPVGTLLSLGPPERERPVWSRPLRKFCSGILAQSSRWIAPSTSIRTTFRSSSVLPPGSLGHNETHPLITQDALKGFHTDKLKLSFLHFDEIEKSSDALWQLLLGILDKATLTLGDNRRVELSQTFILLTSNWGPAALRN